MSSKGGGWVVCCEEAGGGLSHLHILLIGLLYHVASSFLVGCPPPLHPRLMTLSH